MKSLALHWQVIIALILGILFAWVAIVVSAPQIGGPFYGEFRSVFDMERYTLWYIKPFGDIFINVLKLIAVPLVLFSIITGVASLKDINKLGKMGMKTLALYVSTTLLAVVLGLVLVNIFGPGRNQDDATRTRNRIAYELWRNDNHIKALDDQNLYLLPENAALVKELRGTKDKSADNEWVKDKLQKAQNEKASKAKDGPLKPLVDVVPTNIFQSLSGMSMLQIIFFAIFFGVALVMIPPKSAGPVLKVCSGLNDVFIKMILIVMKGMPFFVFALMTGQIVSVAGGDLDAFFGLLDFYWQYALVVILGLIILAFVFYPTFIQLFVRKMGGLRFIRGMRMAQITAFSTSSSLATLPVTMDCVHNNLGVSERTSSFVLPIGATINMDGTSFYQAVAVVAMAQFHMIDLSFGQQATIILTATLASIGAAAIPSAGLVLMILVLESVGLNSAWIAIIFPVDRILDMCRTVVNVTGDGMVSAVIANSEGELNIDTVQ
jgi:Na+/H+-dicarboxylate symporter